MIVNTGLKYKLSAFTFTHLVCTLSLHATRKTKPQLIFREKNPPPQCYLSHGYYRLSIHRESFLIIILVIIFFLPVSAPSWQERSHSLLHIFIMCHLAHVLPCGYFMCLLHILMSSNFSFSVLAISYEFYILTQEWI